MSALTHSAIDRIVAELARDLHDAVDEAEEDGWNFWSSTVDYVLETTGESLYELEEPEEAELWRSCTTRQVLPAEHAVSAGPRLPR
jgi:hypothetical protein